MIGFVGFVNFFFLLILEMGVFMGFVVIVVILDVCCDFNILVFLFFLVVV